MTMTERAGDRSATDFRCSTWTRTLQIDPIGSAGDYDGYLLVEWPLPWPADVAEVRDLVDLAKAARDRRVRLQAIVPAGPARDRDGDVLRVACYHRALEGAVPAGPPGAFAGFGLLERFLPRDEIGREATRLLEDAASGRGPTGDAPPPREILVCTHGRRDRCCGSLGTMLAASLAERPGLLGPGVRISRTSHTGGHRFAPTAIVLPEGTSWAHLDVSLLAQIVSRSGEASEVAPHYRGCAPIGPPALQALERAVLCAPDGPGWALLDSRRWGEIGPGDHAVMHVELARGSVASYSAEVTTRRRVPVPLCGFPIEDAEKSEDELEVAGLRRLP